MMRNYVRNIILVLALLLMLPTMPIHADDETVIDTTEQVAEEQPVLEEQPQEEPVEEQSVEQPVSQEEPESSQENATDDTTDPSPLVEDVPTDKQESSIDEPMEINELNEMFDAVGDTTYYQGYETNDSRFASNKFNLYVRPWGSTITGDVAYCFNYSYKAPEYERQYEEYTPWYIKRDADAATMKAAATASNLSQAELYKNVMRVLYYGYPNDAAGLQEYYGITDDQFRWATQLAIWHFTDNTNSEIYWPSDSQLSACGASGNPYYSLINYTQWNWFINPPKLIEADAPAEYTLHIYQQDKTKYQAEKDYQWLLSADMPDKNTEVTYQSLKVSKTVTGNGGETSKEFTFLLHLTDIDGNVLTDSYYTIKTFADGKMENEEIKPDANGDATFTLSSGQTIEIRALPHGFSYTLQETGADDYVTTINGTKSTNRTISGSKNLDDVSVTYINNKEMIVPTGIEDSKMFYLSTLLVISVGVCCYGIVRKKKHGKGL